MVEIDFYRKPDYIRDLVKKLKKNETKAEKILWSYLRNKKLDGFKFYRQKAIFVYRENERWDRFIIADFYCHSAKLIIEVDGGVHLKKIVKDYDKLKEYLLKNLGYKILRIRNEEVYSSIDEVMRRIKESCSFYSPSSAIQQSLPPLK